MSSGQNSRTGDRYVWQPWKPGDIILDGYRVVRILGRGGMGAVYLVERDISSRTLRFAVKTLRPEWLGDESRRRSFLRELRIWIDLPQHPHLAACRFFRTVRERLAIFSEYVDDGSLESWIRNRRLTNIEDILDTAIQFAWGLQAAHDLGVIHQDVKPGNVLMTSSGIAKVTDFGLARATQASRRSISQSEPSTTPLVSSDGMTLAYCSPEQAAGLKLSRKTDIWSYGLSLLEMFTGEVTWKIGRFASSILDHYLNDIPETGLPRMPEKLTEHLRKCFHDEPDDRWDSMQEIATHLKDLYREITGNPYSREEPAPAVTFQHMKDTSIRSTMFGTKWTDPEEWLTYAYAQAGKTRPETVDINTGKEQTQRARNLLDLEKFEEAEELLRECLDRKTGTDREELVVQMSKMYTLKARLIMSTGDYSGTMLAYNKSIEILEALMAVNPDPRFADALAARYNDRSNIERFLMDYDGSLRSTEIGLKLMDIASSAQDNLDMRKLQSLLYMNRGNALGYLGRDSESLASHDKSIEVLDTDTYRHLAKHDLGRRYMSKAGAFFNTGKYHEALEYCQKSIDILEEQLYQDDAEEVRRDLAERYMNTAMALEKTGQHTKAFELHRSALVIYEKLVLEEGREDLKKVLSMMYQNMAIVLESSGENDGAITHYQKAIRVREQLVYQEGHTEFASDLAMSYESYALLLAFTGKPAESYDFFDKAITIERQLIAGGKVKNPSHCLLYLYRKAWTLLDNGNRPEAMDLIREAERLEAGYDETETENQFAQGIRETKLRIRKLLDATG